MREEKPSHASAPQETMQIEPYYEKWQKLQGSHTTRDIRFAEDWGVHRKFLLFPQHLPDLYLPTKKSFKQTLRESTDADFAARWISFFPTWLQFILSTVALSVSLGVMIFLYILILFQQGLTPSDLKDLDGERIWAVASKTGASGVSIFAGMGFIFATWVSYNTKWREWIYTDSPEWQVKNKVGVFQKWQWEYGDFLKQRGINLKFRQAIKHLIHEYSVSPKPYYWEKRQPCRTKAYMPEFDMDTNQSDTHTALEEGEKLFRDLEQYLEDALSLLTEQERQEYDLFCGTILDTPSEDGEAVKKNELMNLPSAKNYRANLMDELHARTKRVSDHAVQERWQALLDEAKFQDRVLKKSDDLSETTVADLMASLAKKPNGNYACVAIKGNSGLGKTTLVTQMAITLLGPNSQNILPLIKKARKIAKIDESGGIGLRADLEKNHDPYLETWLDSSHRKLLIVDGVDENLELNTYLLDRLHKTAQKYKTHVILTGRNNTLPSGFFETYFLSEFTEDYLDRMIWETSDKPESRSHLNRYIPDKLKQHPLVLFTSAEIVSMTDNFEQADLSFSAISNRIFARDVEVSKRKFGSGKDAFTNDIIAQTIGRYCINKVLKLPTLDVEVMPAFTKAIEWELVDSKGINESLLEGFFVIAALDKVDTEQFYQLWDNLYDSEDLFRWESFIRAYFSVPRDDFPRLLDMNFEDEEDELERAIWIASEEWILGDLATKKSIVSRIGLESDDNGRILLDEDQWLGQLNDFGNNIDVFRALMHFHCQTWMSKTEEWSQLGEDKTWTYLAIVLFAKFSNTIIEDAARQKERLTLDRENPTDSTDPAIESFSESQIKQYASYSLQFSTPMFGYATKNGGDVAREVNLFRHGFLVPTDPLVHVTELGYTKLPQPIFAFLKRAMDPTTYPIFESNEYPPVVFQKIYVFIKAINDFLRKPRFILDYTLNEEAHQFFLDVLGSVNDETSKLWINGIYAILRNHDRRTLDIEHFTYKERASKPSHEILPFPEEFQFQGMVKKWTRVRGTGFQIPSVSRDGVYQNHRVYQERMYSPIPHYLLRGSEFTSYLHYGSVRSSTKDVAWALLCQGNLIHSEFLRLLANKDWTEKHRRVDELNRWLKVYGHVSKTDQVKQKAIDVGLTEGERIVGISSAHRGPDENGRYWVHIPTGSTNSDLYISRLSSPHAWEILNNQFQKNEKSMKLSITVEFSLDFHQIPQTKHCVISPKNLVIICQRCLCEFGGGQKAQNLDVPTFCNQCINSIRDYGLEFHLKQFYSSHVEKVDSISKQITLNSGIKNRTLQTSIQHCLEFFVQDQNELVQWTFRGNHGKAPDENPGAYIHEGPNASLINELISSVYREKQIWAIAKIIERPDVIEIHSHWPGMIIGRKGALLVELQDVLTNSELGRRTVKAVTLTTPFITPVIPDSARDQ